MGSTKIHGMIFASLFDFSFPSSRIFICLSSLHCSYRLLLQQNKQGITTLSSWHSWQRQVLFSVSFASLEWEDTTTDYHPVSHYEWNSNWGTREGRDRTVDKTTTTTTRDWSQRERWWSWRWLLRLCLKGTFQGTSCNFTQFKWLSGLRFTASVPVSRLQLSFRVSSSPGVWQFDASWICLR